MYIHVTASIFWKDWNWLFYEIIAIHVFRFASHLPYLLSACLKNCIDERDNKLDTTDKDEIKRSINMCGRLYEAILQVSSVNVLRLFKTKISMCMTLTLVLICWWGDSEHRSLSDTLEEFSNEQSQDDLQVLLSICVDDFLK